MNQRDMYYQAVHNHADMLRAFSDIMTGANPLTPAELRAMAAKHGRYAFMLKWAERMEAGLPHE